MYRLFFVLQDCQARLGGLLIVMVLPKNTQNLEGATNVLIGVLIHPDVVQKRKEIPAGFSHSSRVASITRAAKGLLFRDPRAGEQRSWWSILCCYSYGIPVVCFLHAVVCSLVLLAMLVP